MLADDLAWGLPLIRAEAEALMIDTCIITRAGDGKGAFNETTGQYDKPARLTVYGPTIAPYFGKCLLQIQSVTNSASASTAGDRAAVIQGDVLELPVMGTGGISVNDVAKMVDVVNDPDLIDREYTVRGRHGKTRARSRRLPVSEVTA